MMKVSMITEHRIHDNSTPGRVVWVGIIPSLRPEERTDPGWSWVLSASGGHQCWGCWWSPSLCHDTEFGLPSLNFRPGLNWCPSIYSSGVVWLTLSCQPPPSTSRSRHNFQWEWYVTYPTTRPGVKLVLSFFIWRLGTWCGCHQRCIFGGDGMLPTLQLDLVSSWYSLSFHLTTWYMMQALSALEFWEVLGVVGFSVNTL